MLNLEQVANTIEELENGSTTFDTCIKLAALYSIQDRHNKVSEPEDVVEKELDDILPQYRKYCEIKKRFQLGQTTETEVLSSLQKVCKEVKEFVQILYSNTNFPEERQYILQTLQELNSTYIGRGT